MMKRSIGVWQFCGFAVTSLVGTLLHFLYDWTNGSVLAAPFSAVNESTWEHMKLFFWPTAIFAAVQWFFFQERREFWCVKLKGILLGLGLIPVLFYTYNGVIGPSPDWVNISIFFLAAGIVYLYETKQFGGTGQCRRPRLAAAAIGVIAAAFILFTFVTPEIGIFEDPTTGAYGISA